MYPKNHPNKPPKRWLWGVEAKQQTTVDLMDDVCAVTGQERLSGIRWSKVICSSQLVSGVRESRAQKRIAVSWVAHVLRTPARKQQKTAPCGAAEMSAGD